MAFPRSAGSGGELVYRKTRKGLPLGIAGGLLGEGYMEGTKMVLHLETGRIIITGPVKSKSAARKEGGNRWRLKPRTW